ncbi:CAP domain-containing protein [Streptomyces glaucescens]|uniref:CAP domain-containing protein n=1 Tax=Streptomyces glaucescens TaxID=1907 RepID=UPI00344C8771
MSGVRRRRGTLVTFAAASLLSTVLLPVTATPSSAQDTCAQLERSGYYDKPPTETGTYSSASVRCLINAERAKRGLPAYKDNSALSAAAYKHARASRDGKWWGYANSHVNPFTGSTIGSRITAESYCPNPTYWRYAEVTYNGWGGSGTPRSAVHWWVYVSTYGHRQIILDPGLTDFGVGSIAGAADAAGVGKTDAGTYVVDFGVCRR